MKELVIKQDELQQLQNILGEIRWKDAQAVINFLNAIAQKRTDEEKTSAQKPAPYKPLSKKSSISEDDEETIERY